MCNLCLEVTLRHSASKNRCSFLNNEMKIYKLRFRHILLFGMLDTALIFTPFNPLLSHNVVHKCEHATFNVDCCYGILQLCVYVSMPIKAFVKFQVMHHLKSSTSRNIFRLLTYKQNIFLCKSDKDIV
jgi:hypothetical protein